MGFIAPLVGGIGSLVGGLLGGKKKSSSATAPIQTPATPLDPSIIALNNSLRGLADFQLEQGKSLLPQALQTLQGPRDFYQTLLSGDHNAMMGLLGPQLNAIREQGQAQQRSFTELLPRSGAMTDRLGSLATSQQGQINDAILNYRPAAASSLTQLGSTYAGLGTGLLGGSGASLSSGLSALLGQRGQDLNAYLQEQARRAENQRALGSGIGGILGILLGPGGILNKGDT